LAHYKEGGHPCLSLSLESMNNIFGLFSDSLFGVKDVLSALGSNTLSLLTPLKVQQIERTIYANGCLINRYSLKK